MLTDTQLKNLKPKSKLYKVNDRDRLYAAVFPSRAISLRYNYRFNGCQETLTFRRYGISCPTLALARQKLIDAKKMIREKSRIKNIQTFGEWAHKLLSSYKMAESTRAKMGQGYL
jgi:hypothetical protein